MMIRYGTYHIDDTVFLDTMTSQLEDNNNSNKTRTREIKWTDDIVRGLNNGSDDEEEEEEEEECTMIDPFKDPDPTKTFSFHFSLSDDDNAIDIDLKGYKKEADQVWKSTGLTIWRAAEMMCNYMIDHSELVTEKHKIIEVRTLPFVCMSAIHFYFIFSEKVTISICLILLILSYSLVQDWAYVEY